MTDKKVNRIASASLLAALLVALLLPMEESGRIFAAILLLLSAIIIPRFVKKRPILSIYKRQVLIIISVIALLYVMIFYLSGLEFGYYKNPYRFAGSNIWRFFLPIAVIIVATERVRYVLMAQKDALTRAMCYISCIIADMLICSNIPSVTSFNTFMELVAGTFFPALLSNILYNYLAKRYGMYPNIVFRLITILHAYTFYVTSGISQSLVNLFKLFLPIIIYFFIDALFEKKVRYALGNKSRLWKITSAVLTAIVVIIMVGTVMLVSNQFKYGALVIATESMTGELNKGDVVLFERYEDHHVIEEGQVIVFEKRGSMIVHRVVEIEIINGVARYYTKGDANEDNDEGFITNAEIVGVTSVKLPYFGYPTLWMRNLFKR